VAAGLKLIAALISFRGKNAKACYAVSDIQNIRQGMA
jgi:hypothetical protein